jgi:hypothetical protein
VIHPAFPKILDPGPEVQNAIFEKIVKDLSEIFNDLEL